MLQVLGWVVQGVGMIGKLVLWGLVTFANLVIAAIGTLIATVLGLLPSMPAVPAPPDVVGYINWLFPIGDVVLVFASFVTLWIAFLAIRIVMRWVKAL